MRYFFDEQGRTRVFARGVRLYVEGGNPRRTPVIGKIAIYGWKLININSGTSYFYPSRVNDHPENGWLEFSATG